jgi:hypothetical protein
VGTPDDIVGGGDTPAETAEAAPERDVRSEPIGMDADALVRDVASEDVASEPPPPPDGSCNPPYTCAAPVPTGWSGPALFWIGAASLSPPACPADYQSQDLQKDLTGTGAGTCSCNCGLNDNCTATVSFHPDQGCSTPTCPLPDGGTDTIQVTLSPTSGCVQIPDNNCGTDLTGGSVATTNPTAYQATCDPTVTPTIPTAGWDNSARLCSTSCSASTEPCVIGPTAGFGATACIFQSGDVACPSTTYVKKSLYYTGMSDTRTCSPCTCNGSDGGTCVFLGAGNTPASNLTVYGTSDCSVGAGSWTDLTLDICSVYNATNSTLTASPASLIYVPTIRHGTCSGVSTQPQPMGSVSATGATTVCCE